MSETQLEGATQRELDEQSVADTIANLRKETFNIKNVSFKINKLPVMTALNVIEELRYGLGEKFEGLGDDNDYTAQFFKMIMSLPPELVARIRETLFTEVVFSKPPEYKGFVPLVGLEDAAFESLSPFSVYEVLVRCLVVNFIDSLEDISLRFGIDPQSFNPSAATTSIPGSQQSSEATQADAHS